MPLAGLLHAHTRMHVSTNECMLARLAIRRPCTKTTPTKSTRKCFVS